MNRVRWCLASNAAIAASRVAGSTFREMNISPLPAFLRPRVGEDKRAALPVDLCDMRSAVLVVAPGAREAEPVNVKAERGPTYAECKYNGASCCTSRLQ